MPLLNEEEIERFRTKACHKVRSTRWCDNAKNPKP